VNLRILGSGTSSGVPRIGNDWGSCDPADPRNRRTRASILIEAGGATILVDSSPDMRQQLLDADIATIDAVIWTHEHADHTHGIDDLRQLFHARGAPVPGYARAETLATLEVRFGYCFAGRYGYPPTTSGHLLTDAADIAGIAVTCVDMPHGEITSAGLRFDHEGRSIGYATDFSAVTDEMRKLFEGVDLFVVDALRHKPHPTHPHLAMTLDLIASARPKRTFLTHMDQTMDYATLAAELPAGIEPGVDGQQVALA
jgi:phosphoribosyl 1,2-cyclic phosphate phosphodiesterase